MNQKEERADDNKGGIASLANSIAMMKFKSIANKAASGEELSVGEARFAQQFAEFISLRSLLKWLEQLRETMDTEEDAGKVQQFMDNIKEGARR